MLINQSLLDALATEAAASSRRRKTRNFHLTADATAHRRTDRWGHLSCYLSAYRSSSWNYRQDIAKKTADGLTLLLFGALPHGRKR